MFDHPELVSFSYNDLAINSDDIELALGYPQNAAPAHFIDMINNIIIKLPGLLDIRTGYSIFKMSLSGNRKDGLMINGKFFKMENLITSHLRKSEMAAIIVCTIGPGLETWSRQLLKEGDIALSYIADTTASLIVDRLADLLCGHLNEIAGKNNLKLTNRYSPGYCGWSVADQHLLFSLLPENFCGIKLNESALMVPVKSISAVTGLGKDVTWREYSCEKCNIIDCNHREYVKRHPIKTRLK